MVKDKYKTRPSEATKETKKGKNLEESEPTYKFHGQSARSQHWFDIYPNHIEDKFMTREAYLKKVRTLNVFQVKLIRIGLNFQFDLDLKKKQVKFNLSQTPLSWLISNTTKTFSVLVV